MRRTSSRKDLGQHFMQDWNILEKEAELAEVSGKTVLEIGSGDGRLTEVLLRRKPKRILAVEKDERLVTLLQDKFCCGGEKVLVLPGDVLELELPDFDIVVGNIPYYISSDIIFLLAEHPFERGVLMVQNEFALKMAAKPGDKNYGRLSVTSQLAFSVKVVRKVPRHLFSPPPKVDSAIILIKPTGNRLTKFQEDIIRWLFQHRNKTVRNALLDSGKFGKEGLEPLKALAKKRVRTVSKEECLRIAELLSHSENSSAS